MMKDGDWRRPVKAFQGITKVDDGNASVPAETSWWTRRTIVPGVPVLEIELIKPLHDHTSPTFLITYTPLYYITSFISMLSI